MDYFEARCGGGSIAVHWRSVDYLLRKLASMALNIRKILLQF
jgi:hypothetical protein